MPFPDREFSEWEPLLKSLRRLIPGSAALKPPDFRRIIKRILSWNSALQNPAMIRGLKHRVTYEPES